MPWWLCTKLPTEHTQTTWLKILSALPGKHMKHQSCQSWTMFGIFSGVFSRNISYLPRNMDSVCPHARSPDQPHWAIPAFFYSPNICIGMYFNPAAHKTVQDIINEKTDRTCHWCPLRSDLSSPAWRIADSYQLCPDPWIPKWGPSARVALPWDKLKHTIKSSNQFRDFDLPVYEPW